MYLSLIAIIFISDTVFFPAKLLEVMDAEIDISDVIQ